MITQAVLLVGGPGTRLRPLSYKLPKALMPVANLPLIAYEIIPLVRAGIKQIIFALGYKADLLRRQLGEGKEWGAEFIYVEEETPLDTAGAIGNVRELIEGPFFACNGDIIYDVDLAALAAAHLERKALVTFCVRTTRDIRHFGLIQWHDDGRVYAFKEKVGHDETGRCTVNSGFYVMSPEILAYIPKGRPYSNERDLFPDLLRRGCPLYVYLPARQGYWTDVGRLETYLQANYDILEGCIPWKTASVPSKIASTAQIKMPVDIAPHAHIGENVIVGPDTSIGANVIIEQGAIVSRSVVWPGSCIGRQARIFNSIIAGAQVPAGAGIINGVLIE